MSEAKDDKKKPNTLDLVMRLYWLLILGCLCFALGYFFGAEEQPFKKATVPARDEARVIVIVKDGEMEDRAEAPVESPHSASENEVNDNG